MKKPITLGKLLIMSTLIYFISAFFIYITQYSFNEFWYVENPKDFYMYSAGFGFMLLIFGSFMGLVYFITTITIPKFIVEFIIKIWNYPVIK